MRILIFFIITVTLEACLFCNPAVLQRQGVYEDEQITIIHALTPAVDGNLIVIPKRHMIRFEHLTGDEMLAIQKGIQKVAAILPQAYGIDDYVIIEKNGLKGGQTVDHIHFHVIPAEIDFDKIIDTAFHFRRRLTDEEMAMKVNYLRPFFQN